VPGRPVFYHRDNETGIELPENVDISIQSEIIANILLTINLLKGDPKGVSDTIIHNDLAG